MKKLLQERGHMLENHVERLWAYLTIQELLAKRYDRPLRLLGRHCPPQSTPQPQVYCPTLLTEFVSTCQSTV